MNPTLGDALHQIAGDVGDLGDIDRALHQVRTRRIRIAAGAMAATCIAVMLVVLAVPMPTPVEPADPEPTPAVEVLRPADGPIPSLVDAPLPGGADVAVADNDRAVVWADGTPRRVPGASRLYWTSLSPDGRYHASVDGSRSLQQALESGTGGGDLLVITDLTTGRGLLRWQMVVDGLAAQAPRHVWSGDSQRLFLVVVPTEDTDQEPLPRGVLHVWQRQGGAFVPAGTPIPLPGVLIGVDETGQRVLVEEAGGLTELSVDTGQRESLGTQGQQYRIPQPQLADVRGWGYQLGQGCWDPQLNRVCWVGLAEPGSGPTDVGWLDLSTGQWTWLSGGLAGGVRFVGWQQGALVVLTSEDTSRPSVLRLSERGAVALRVFDTARPSNDSDWSFGLSLTDPALWSAP